MGVLDFIFGTSDEDDLEATQPEIAPTLYPQTQAELDATLKSMRGNLPTRAMGAKLHPTWKDELGNPMIVDMWGNPIYLEMDPDYDPNKKGIIPEFLDAPVEKLQEAYEGTKDVVNAFRTEPLETTAAMVSGINQELERMFRGEGTGAELISAVAGMPLAAKGLKAANLIKIEDGDGAIAGMFYPARVTADGRNRIKKAEELQNQGADRDEIWKQTGLWQIASSDKRTSSEWLAEIDDSQSEIFLTQGKNSATKGPVTKTITFDELIRSGGINPSDAQYFKQRAMLEMLAIRKQIDNGDITAEEGLRQANEIQAELNKQLNDKGTTETVTKTKTVTVPNQVSKKLITGGAGSATLDEVLNHEELFQLLRDEDAIRPAGVVAKLPTAEAGARAASTAGDGGTLGVYRSGNNVLTGASGKSRISSYKNAGITGKGWKNLAKDNADRNERDKEILRLHDEGRISTRQAAGDLIWSTMLHETQHFLDDYFKSETGRGNNPTEAKAKMKKITDKYDSQLAKQEKDYSLKTLMLIEGISKTGASSRKSFDPFVYGKETQNIFDDLSDDGKAEFYDSLLDVIGIKEKPRVQQVLLYIGGKYNTLSQNVIDEQIAYELQRAFGPKDGTAEFMKDQIYRRLNSEIDNPENLPEVNEAYKKYAEYLDKKQAETAPIKLTKHKDGEPTAFENLMNAKLLYDELKDSDPELARSGFNQTVLENIDGPLTEDELTNVSAGLLNNFAKPVVQNALDTFNAIKYDRDIQLAKVIKEANGTWYDLYWYEQGELKSALTQARRAMSPEARAEIPPYKMLNQMGSDRAGGVTREDLTYNRRLPD